MNATDTQPDFTLQPTASGTLDELTFTIAATLGAPTSNATVAQLLAAGATLHGITPTPAEAVAAGNADFALDQDLNGSLRIAASANQLFAIRTTHPGTDFSALGWLASDPAVFRKLADVLLPATKWHSLQLISAPFGDRREALRTAYTTLAATPTDAAAQATQAAWQQEVSHLLKKAVMPLATIGADAQETQALTSLAELAGCPQVVIPTDDGGSRSFISPSDSDAGLVAYALHRASVHVGDC